MTSAKISPAIAWQPAANLALLAALWGMLAWQLAYEWSHNGQYSYGLFVPFLALYLLHLRWEDRPAPITPKAANSAVLLTLITVAVVAHYPMKVIFEANADWRLIIWSQALIIFGITLVLLWRWGGTRWVLHFGFPFFFILTAVPWPRWLEDQLVVHLMEWVATATVETVNFLGIYAKQSGNIIILKTGMVSVEEACSGVRSFQSTVMGAIFLGELLRFRVHTRVALVVVGSGFALFFNFCRTLALTLITSEHGTEVMQRWHDPAGYLVFVLSLGALGVLCLILRRWVVRRPASRIENTGGPFYIHPGWLPLRPVAVIIGLLLLTQPVAKLWFAIRGPLVVQQNAWAVNWNAGTQNLRFEKIEPRIKDVLFFDEGELVYWTTPNKYHWIAYFFEWGSGKAAQLGGVHNPELCMPAVGWGMMGPPGEMTWRGPDGLELVFNTYRFVAGKREVYVFYCQWDPQGYPYHTKAGRFRLDRLRDAWIGDRKDGKQLLEVIIEGPKSMDKAQEAMLRFLDQSIQVEATPVPNSMS